MSRILWFTPARGYSTGIKLIRQGFFKAKRIPAGSVFDVNLHSKQAGLTFWKKAGKGVKEHFNWAMEEKTKELIDGYLRTYSPRLCVVNDYATLCAITGRDNSLFLCRGSVFIYNGVPFIVVDNLNINVGKYNGWLLANDIDKIYRWFTNTQRQIPKFRYTVCRTRADLEKAFLFLSNSICLSIDSETKNRFVTCIGYTGLHRDGSVHTFVIPFFNPRKEGGCHWDSSDDEVYAWQIVREIHATEIVKVFQNGSYDNAYFLVHLVPTRNWYLDTMHLWHCVFTELPKKINFIASVFLDYFRYWKDENKGDKEDAIGNSDEMLERYWRYNALDCFYTLCSCISLVRLVVAVKDKAGNQWALKNYAHDEFPRQVGPAFWKTMTGMLVDKHRQKVRMDINEHKRSDRLAAIRRIVGEPDFNPNSPDQFAQLLYDVLGATPLKGRGKSVDKYKRSTDEKVLKHIAQQHPFYDFIITKIYEVKKPRNNMSKYGVPHQTEDKKWHGLFTLNGRFLYAYNAAGTETWRYSSKGHHFWLGNNAQNWPVAEREILIADPSYVLLDADYSQSDAWFVAFSCEDPDYIATMTSGKDTHAIHAEHFFKIAYERIVKGNKADEEWCTHPTKGIRNITKRIVHGANFRMAAFTLYMLMGKDSCSAAGRALNYDVADWEQDDCVALCERLLKAFIAKYKKLPEWFRTSVIEVAKNGNLATNAFGNTRLFFGNIEKDEAIQRELSAFYGQSGTAGNINRTLNHIFYKTDLIKQGVEMRLQTHDSLTFAIPVEILHSAAEKILTIMQQPCTIKGRQFTVPADANVGLTWGKKGMIKYRPDITYSELVQHDYKTFAAKYDVAA